MKLINRLTIAILVLVVVLSVVAIFVNAANAEGHDYKDRPRDFSPYGDAYEPVTMYITGDGVNGRNEPVRKGQIGCLPFYRGDTAEAIFWSKNHKWVEVLGGENGTVYVYYEYITERTDIYKVKNLMRGKVRIRRTPVNGGVVGYVKENQTVKIYQTIFGWGRTDKGWVDLNCFYEIDD